MGTIRKSITFTDKLSEWMQVVIHDGDYTNESEYIRDLVRKDRERNAKLLALREAVQKGWDSGVSDRQIPDILKSVEEKMRADGRI